MKLVTITIILMFPLYVFSQRESTFLAEEFAASRKENKNIILYFSGSDWCKPCMVLKKKVIDSESFQEFSKNYIIKHLDFPRDEISLSEEYISERDKITEKYNPDGNFPYLLLINNKGEILSEVKRYQNETTEQIIHQLSTNK